MLFCGFHMMSIVVRILVRPSYFSRQVLPSVVTPWTPWSSGVVCWVPAVPTGCERIAPHSCTRGGEKVHLFGLWLLTVPVMIRFFLIVMLMVLAITVWWRIPRRAADKASYCPVLSLRCYVYHQAAVVDHGDDNGACPRKQRSFVPPVLDQRFVDHFLSIQGLFSFLTFIRSRYLVQRKPSGTQLQLDRLAVGSCTILRTSFTWKARQSDLYLSSRDSLLEESKDGTTTDESPGSGESDDGETGQRTADTIHLSRDSRTPAGRHDSALH